MTRDGKYPWAAENSHPLLTWSIGKPYAVVYTAIECASAANAICELLQFVVREEGAGTLPRTFSVAEWQACYRDPERSFLRALRTFPEDPEFGFDSEGAYQVARTQKFISNCAKKGRLDVLPDVQITAADLVEAFNEMQAGLKATIEDLDRTFSYEGSDEAAEQALNNIDLRFHMEVALPAIIEYHETADSLLEKAIKKDWIALRKLARIDKWVTRFPEVYQLEDSGSTGDALAYEEATRLTKEHPAKGHLDAQKLKVNLAAAMAHIASGMGYQLTGPAIRELFDIIAKRYYGKERDTDLPFGKDAFQKAVQREKQSWQQVFPHPPPDDILAFKDFRKRLNKAFKKPKPRKAA